MARHRTKRRGLFGTAAEHAVEARSFLDSARKNFERHGDVRARYACGNIEHMTDVIAEATVATIAASHAGDMATEEIADRLRHNATMKQREMVDACRRRDRTLVAHGVHPDEARRGRR